MAGHSHWANIKHKKAAADAKKGKVITQMSRLIKGAIVVGGNDIDTNPRLRLAVAKARAQNMTNDAIDRAIARFGGGGDDGKVVEELTYEGYAMGGVAVVVESMSDNRNRTAPEIRKLFERGGGSMGAPGCVAWQFKEKSLFQVEADSEDAVMEALLAADADAEDIRIGEPGRVEVVAAPEMYDRIRTALDAASLAIAASDITRIADNQVEIDDLETAQRITKLLESLDDHDDVTAVHSNFSPTAAIAEQL